ncbi:MAG: hypothetical protein JW807_11760 [Spirochaetes bacterium]|nr:hypothetical protein [Spirochaetota bacterium]
MDIAGIKNIIKEYLKPYLNFSLLWSKVKEALKLPYAKTYIALAFVLTAIFWVFTFPYDMLIRKELKNLEKGVVRNIYISGIDFSLIDIISLNNIYVILKNGNEITIRNADIDISFLRLLISKDVKGTVQIGGFKYHSDTSQVSLNLNGNISLDFKSFSDLPKGGTFNIIADNAVLKIGEINLPGGMGGLPIKLPFIKISSIKMEADITNQKLNIKNIRIFGKDLNGEITGTIGLTKSFINSTLDLKLTMNADSPVFESYRDFLLRFINNRNQLVLPIRGTLLMPQIDFSQSETAPAPAPEAETETDHPMDKILPVQ